MFRNGYECKDINVCNICYNCIATDPYSLDRPYWMVIGWDRGTFTSALTRNLAVSLPMLYSESAETVP